VAVCDASIGETVVLYTVTLVVVLTSFTVTMPDRLTLRDTGKSQPSTVEKKSWPLLDMVSGKRAERCKPAGVKTNTSEKETNIPGTSTKSEEDEKELLAVLWAAPNLTVR
jgi:hypothetical protein